MRVSCALFLVWIATASVCGQSNNQLVIKGAYTAKDSLQVIEAFEKATVAVDHMYEAMNAIWEVSDDVKDRQQVRKERWLENDSFTTWLGRPEKISKVKNRIRKIRNRFDKEVILVVSKQNKGKCRGWISAWAIPFGKVKITLCEDFFIYRTHLQEKVLIHEVGHEVGMLLHRRIHGCRAAKRAANSSKKHIAKRSTENYAWLAMSFLGLDCSF